MIKNHNVKITIKSINEKHNFQNLFRDIIRFVMRVTKPGFVDISYDYDKDIENNFKIYCRKIVLSFQVRLFLYS